MRLGLWHGLKYRDRQGEQGEIPATSDVGQAVQHRSESWPDLVLAGPPQSPDRLFVNDGSGRFHELAGALPPKPFGPGSEGLDVALIDLNGDGRTDLLMAFTKGIPFYQGRWIQVLMNNGDGTFRDETSTRLPQTDNHDGRLDIVSATAGNQVRPTSTPSTSERGHNGKAEDEARVRQAATP